MFSPQESDDVLLTSTFCSTAISYNTNEYDWYMYMFYFKEKHHKILNGFCLKLFLVPAYHDLSLCSHMDVYA